MRAVRFHEYGGPEKLDAALAALDALDGVADTVGGDLAAKLFRKVRNGGRFGYASVFPAAAATSNPSVEVTRVFARPDASKVREFADAIRDREFSLPVSLRMPLSQAVNAHELMEKGGAGKIVLLI